MPDPRWLILIHQIPPSPSYLRVKVGRRLQGLGAVAVKNSVYVLPRSDQALEDFQWVRREIVAGGGDAWVCEARFVEGLADDGVEGLFDRAREADYQSLEREARELQAAVARRGKKSLPREAAEAAVAMETASAAPAKMRCARFMVSGPSEVLHGNFEDFARARE